MTEQGRTAAAQRGFSHCNGLQDYTWPGSSPDGTRSLFFLCGTLALALALALLLLLGILDLVQYLACPMHFPVALRQSKKTANQFVITHA